mgnify:CR=1 FL=1
MGQPILEVEHLKKSYVNNVPILDDVSFCLLYTSDAADD